MGVIILLIASAGVYLFLTRNKPPVIVSLEAPSVVAINEIVSLTSSATDEDGDTLTYTWQAEAGTISGEGSTVTYTAPKTAGTYTLTVSVSDGRGGRTRRSINIEALLLWQKTYGGKDLDWASSIQQTKDGGYIVAGGTESFGAGGYDFYILKLDSTGKVLWEKTYGGEYYDEASSIQQTKDGGYIVAGYTTSFGTGSLDFYLLKLDPQGKVLWEKTYGGEYWDGAFSIQQTQDGGYIVAGYTTSFGAGEEDFYILKLDPQGKTGPYPMPH
ncbi:Ig-like domain-containing protein [Candidatus Hakubella thermalkaliphila]|uniref:Ig-like domain-containing protein n=1 Tax=Candidatus Hakubella thermalkaliphila TaxID=2754717 RepID=UPI001593582C|nr:PKD domain-containing protein [Candidatus Hakubella thermalkaliphila]